LVILEKRGYGLLASWKLFAEGSMGEKEGKNMPAKNGENLWPSASELGFLKGSPKGMWAVPNNKVVTVGRGGTEFGGLGACQKS